MNLAALRSGHIERAADLLTQILESDRLPADAQMDAFFRAHKEMGKRDRGLVAEMVYGVLRQLRLLDARLGSHAEGGAAGRMRIAAWLVHAQGLARKALLPLLPEALVDTLLARLRENPAKGFDLPTRLSLPDAVWQAWVQQYGQAEAEKLAQSLLMAAPADVRVNRLKATVEQVQQALAEAGFTLETVAVAPLALRSQDRSPLFRTDAFLSGWFELQDVGSQIIGALLPVAPGQKVTDFCAGAGGKTLQLAAAMNNKGSLTACDVSARRLERMRPRLARAGVDNVRILPLSSETDSKLKKLKGTQDGVLVDAPCSGSGTWRRSPDLKWRGLDLDTLTTTQANVLASAARLVRPGGHLVYATCSLLDAENGQIVQAFMQQHPEFSLLPAQSVLTALGYDLPDSAFTPDGAVQLRPDLHATDGFYAVLLQRASD